MKQAGGIQGPDGSVTHYVIEKVHGHPAVIEFGSAERPGAGKMFVDELAHHLGIHYTVRKPDGGWTITFTAEEKAKLRPIAETLAMLDGNAFFGQVLSDGREWFEMYLPEAHALYEANGGDAGWPSGSSFTGK